MRSFTEPDFTSSATDLQIDTPPQRPMPEIVETSGPPLTDPIDEPLVPLAHRRIRTLTSYWHAGWDNARPSCWIGTAAMERLALVAEGLPDR